MGPQKEEALFFILALVVIIIGYAIIIESDTLLHTAAVAKTGKTYSAQPTGKAYTAPANTTASDSASSSTASYQQNGSNAYAQLQEQPLYGSNVTHNQSSAETVNASSTEPASEEQSYLTSAPEKPKSLPEASPPKLPTAASTELTLALDVNIETTANKTSLISLDINNPTSTAVIIQPVLQEIPLALPNEEKIRALLAEELLADPRVEKSVLPQKIQENLELLQLLEKEKVKPIHIHKVYHPFQLLTSAAITAITYSGKRTSGELLQRPAFDSFIVPALEQKKVTLEIPSSLSAAGREVQLSLLADGEKKYAAKLKVQPSFAVDFGIDTEARRMDIYLSIPADADENKDENEKHEYLVELQIMGGKRTIYYELFGPYLVAGSESALFSQEFEYDPAIIKETKVVKLTAFKEGQIIQKAERTADFGEGKI